MATIPDESEDIETRCMASPSASSGDERRCGKNAVAYARSARGYRVYLCRDHAEEAARFDEDLFDGGVPRVSTCGGCGRFTPTEKMSGGRFCDDCE